MGAGVLLPLALLLLRLRIGHTFLVTPRDAVPSPKQRGPSTPIAAIIFGPDGTTTLSEDEAPPSLPPNDTLLATVDSDTWKRIACAFADPPLSPSQVQQAHLVELVSESLSISVTVVDSGDDTCVQVLVQVPFPEGLQQMADDPERHMELLQTVDTEARRRLEEREYLADTAAARERITRGLLEVPKELPDWWIHADSFNERALAEECTKLQELLNQDEFAEDLRALFIQRFPKPIDVAKASVTVVGPLGMYLKAYAQEGASSPFTTIPLAIQFSAAMEHQDDVRNAVLDIMDAIHQDTPGVEANGDKVDTLPEESFTSLGADEDVDVEVVATTDRSITSTQSKSSKKDPMVGHDPASNVAADVSHHMEPSASEISDARQQPKSPEKEEQLAAKYAAIEDLGDRAYAILKDLYMI